MNYLNLIFAQAKFAPGVHLSANILAGTGEFYRFGEDLKQRYSVQVAFAEYFRSYASCRRKIKNTALFFQNQDRQIYAAPGCSGFYIRV